MSLKNNKQETTEEKEASCFCVPGKPAHALADCTAKHENNVSIVQCRNTLAQMLHSGVPKVATKKPHSCFSLTAQTSILLTLQCRGNRRRQQRAAASIPRCPPGSRWHYDPGGRTPPPCCRQCKPV